MSGSNADFNKQYKYDEMSNKVIRGGGKRPTDGVDADPTSLAGQISVKDMGTAIKSLEPNNNNNKSNSKANKSSNLDSFSKSEYNGTSYSFQGSTSEALTYRPTNQECAHVFDLMMTWVHNYLTDSSHDVILSASDTILEILKNESDQLSLQDKKREIGDLLDIVILDISFNELINLSKRITDYSVLENTGDDEGEEEDAVALVFDDAGSDEDEQGHDSVDGDDDEEQVHPEDDVEENALSNGEAVISASTQEIKDETLSILPLHTVDEFFLQRKVASLLKSDPESLQRTTDRLLTLLSDSKLSTRELENELMELFDFDHFQFIKFCIENRWRIVFKLRILSSSGEEDKEKVFEEMRLLGLQDLVSEISSNGSINNKKRRLSNEDTGSESNKKAIVQKREPKLVDLDALSFDQGSHLMTNTKVKLPPGSFQQKKKLYDVISVPPPALPPSLEESNEKLVTIESMPEWTRCIFPSSETSSLNRIQSKVYPLAFGNDENLLLCAPTGAGKTNVAMLSALRVINNYRDPTTGRIDLHKFKIVYIAPLKALVQEQMREFQRRLTPNFGIVVNELTGDSSLTKQQISETQVLVTTPEKWDVITRKSTDLSYTNLTKLIIIDEIHLLHDERGPVLESIVSRTLRQTETSGEPVRIIGLSATLPNFRDVASFLRVDINKNLFYFDSSFRPCPLEQQYIGIKEKKAIKKLNAMNEACFDKVLECATNKHQLIIFVHSRKDTYRTAKWIQEKLIEENKLEMVLKSDAGSVEILKLEASIMKNQNLQEILPKGFGIHHAGLNKDERLTVEDLFAQGHIQVLVSTATLAWGVNLPAHTVVIKGTETYSPEKGCWVQLSPQDILQMLGRAGRPRYDKSGEGVIITSQDEIQYYLAILNQQLPIESQLMSKLADSINAEVVLGTIKSRDDAVKWLGYTYLYVRMLQSPAVYHVGAEYGKDETLFWKRVDLSHSALTLLQNNKLVNYNSDTGEVRATDLGKISSHFYINYSTINMFNIQLKPWHTEIEILKIFASSGEFKYIPIRQEERMEVTKLLERCPIPIRESPSDPLAKVNVLLQSYISKLSLEGFALMADMVYITQSAGRLLRAIHEIVLKKGWSAITKTTLNLCKMVEKRMWMSSSPFRQFGDQVPKEIIRTTENSHLPFMSYFTLSAAELAESVNLKGNSKRAYDILQQFPKVSFNYSARPITPSLLQVQLEILPEWEWNVSLHGNYEPFLLLVEDCDGEKILHSEKFMVYRNYINDLHYVEFTVPLSDPIQPVYFVTVLSERWLHSEWKAPLILDTLRIPKKSPAFTELLDLQLVPTSALEIPSFVDLFDFSFFNKFQSQLFQTLYKTNDSVFIGTSKGNGKSTLAELAILNNWRQNKGRAVYINPSQENVNKLYLSWSKKFKNIDGESRVIRKLTGDLTTDISILGGSHLILATAEQFDIVSRRWRQRKAVQLIELFIFDDAHMIGAGEAGLIYESIVSRMRLISAQLGNDLRFVGLSSSLANGRDFAEWFGCTKQNVFNFDPTMRFHKIEEIRLQAFDITQNDSMILSMIKPCYSYLKANTTLESQRSLVFVPSRTHCVEVGIEILQLAAYDNWKLERSERDDLDPYLNKVVDVALREALSNGIGYYYSGMNATDKLIVEKLFNANLLTILVATQETAEFSPSANSVVVLSTRQYEGKEHRYIDYTINNLLEMIGCCTDESQRAKTLILTSTPKLNYYNKFLNEGLPIESFMDIHIHDAFTTEISTRTFKSKQDCMDWLTFTYFYRRLQSNPSFYGVKDTSHVGMSEYLSDLIEKTLKDLEECKIVELEDDESDDEEEEDEDNDDEGDEISPLDGAMIAGYYNVSYLSMKEFNKLTNRTKLKEILEIITNAYEFASLPIRHNESAALRKLHARVPVKASVANYESPHFKAFLLLQAHFSRITLPADLAYDQKCILQKVLRLLYACIDTLSSEGHLNAVHAMDLSQMIVQGVWDRDNPLKQVPHFDSEILGRCKTAGVDTVYDIMSLEDEERDDVLRLTGKKLEDVADFVNKYPNVDISYELDGSTSVVHDEPTKIAIILERDEDMDDLEVVSEVYPITKNESWWVVIGDSKTKQLYAIKKTTIAKESQTINLEFTVPNAGHHELTVWCMCDSYVDADKEITFELDVL